MAISKRVENVDCITLKAFCQFVADMGWQDSNFTKNDAVVVFKSVQDADDEAGDSYMDRNEFMFAIVAISLYRVPSPLISAAQRVNLFLTEQSTVRLRTGIMSPGRDDKLRNDLRK